jgi:hypothetical protein
MTSPWRDPERKGGWVPWRERLLPLIAMPGEWVDFPMSSRTVAKTTANNLRRGDRGALPGIWEFKACDGKVRARYLGPYPRRKRRQGIAKSLPVR